MQQTIVWRDVDEFRNKNILIEQIDLFITLFHGRTDVYAKRIISKAGYLQGQWD